MRSRPGGKEEAQYIYTIEFVKVTRVSGKPSVKKNEGCILALVRMIVGQFRMAATGIDTLTR